MGTKKPGKSVPKIGVYLPEHRLEEVKKWRGEIEFSELFWQAWDREIARRTVSTPKGSEMNKLIERLRKEAGEEMAMGEKEGAKCGKKWAIDTAARKDLRAVGEGAPSSYGSVVGLLINEYRDLGYHREWWDNLTEPYADKKSFRLGFCRGFSNAVRDIWKKLPESLQ
jgi:hypothetical protein